MWIQQMKNISLSAQKSSFKGRLHELIKGPFSAPISGPYVVSRSVLALKTGPF